MWITVWLTEQKICHHIATYLEGISECTQQNGFSLKNYTGVITGVK